MILDNLLSNAIKYTPEGVITLSLEKESDEYTAIRITDTGYGISEDAIPHVFERYYQEGSDYQASGTGIGLSLVKNLVELHGGDIRVESTLGEGSCFILTLPTHYTYPGVPHTQEETEIKEWKMRMNWFGTKLQKQKINKYFWLLKIILIFGITSLLLLVKNLKLS